MAEPHISPYQGGDIVMTSYMLDGGVPSAAGRAQFLAPCAGRVVGFGGVFEDGLSATTTFTIDHMIAAATDPTLTYSTPAVAEGESFWFNLSEGDSFQVDKNAGFEIISGGEGVSTRPGYFTLVFRPNDPNDLPQGAFVLTGVNTDGTAAYEGNFHCPIPGGGELIFFGTVIGLNTTATYTATLLKNGSASVAAAAITTNPKGTVAVQDFNSIDADRHFDYDDHIAITGSAAAGSAGSHAFTAVFRPVGVR